MNYYALSWDEAGTPRDQFTGDRCACYHVFDSRAGRDAWVKGGSGSKRLPDYREALSSSDSELRRYQRLYEREDVLYWHYRDEERTTQAHA